MRRREDDILERVRGCYGAVRLRDLDLDRTEYRQAERLVAAGDLVAHPRGVVSLPGVDRDLVLARIHGGVITCQRAAQYYGLCWLVICVVTSIRRGR